MEASATMEPTAPAKSMKPAASTESMEPTPTAKTPSGECRAVCHDAKRANRNARRQNAYCSFAHSAILTRSS
jgi:hypothetical protein